MINEPIQEKFRKVHERRLKKRHSYFYSRVYDENTHQQTGRLVDISTGGIRLVSENPIKTNSIFQLKMVLPKEIEGKRTITFDAVSSWCNRAANSDLYDSGFKLVDISPQNVDIIKHLIRDTSLDF